MRLLPTAVFALATSLLASSAARADRGCSAVNGPIVTTYTTDGCTSPVGVCTVGTAQLGRKAATTRFTALTITPADPSGAVLLYTGELVITTRKGSVTIHDAGVLNAATGEFFELQKVVGGTKSYKHATGLLTSQGTATGTGFSGTLTGEVCRVDDEGGRG